MVIFPGELTAHTARGRMCAKLPTAAPVWANLPGDLPGGICPLRQTAIRGRRKSWATMPLRQTLPRFRYGGFARMTGKNRHRGGHCAGGIPAASQLRFPPVHLPVLAGKRRSSRPNKEEPTILRSRHGHFREYDPSRTKNPHEKPAVALAESPWILFRGS